MKNTTSKLFTLNIELCRYLNCLKDKEIKENLYLFVREFDKAISDKYDEENSNES